MTSSRATLIQVAERAGASLASTSRALHGSGASKAMVERVRAAAEELGYSPDVIGRSLRMKRTFQVAFAVADIGNPVYVEMMSAIHEVLAPHGYRVVVMTTGDTIASTRDLVRSLSSGFVDGMILSPLRMSDDLVDEILHAAVPVVVIGRSLRGQGVESVSTDSAGGIAQAVDHLLGIGRRHLGFLNGPVDTTPGAARLRGFEAATSAPGFAGDAVAVETAEDFTVAAGLVAARRLLGRTSGAGLDAVVAANDLLAIGAIQAAREHGLRIPEDLAVTGMDDTEIGRVFQPSLTSVSLRSTERGRVAARLMLGLVDAADTGGSGSDDGVDDAAARGSERADAPPTSATIEPTLLVRESTVVGERASAPPGPGSGHGAAPADDAPTTGTTTPTTTDGAVS